MGKTDPTKSLQQPQRKGLTLPYAGKSFEATMMGPMRISNMPIGLNNVLEALMNLRRQYQCGLPRSL